jgi:putative oxidoreductase
VKGGYEYPLFWLIIMIAIFFKGGGKVSIDSSLPKEF